MAKREYPGYPEVVVIALPKCGTKTMNKCFTSLGYKVFDVQQVRAELKISLKLFLSSSLPMLFPFMITVLTKYRSLKWLQKFGNKTSMM